MKDMTLIVVILDRSGSMSSISTDAVGMFNNFLREQKALPDYAEMTLVQFDDLYERHYTRKPIAECEDLVLGKTFCPRGCTAMYDAIGKTINSVGEDLANLPEEERPNKILFVILTDGFENASKEYTGHKVNKMIQHQKETYSWDFIFLAAGIDVTEYSKTLGIDMSKCASFSHSGDGMRDVMNVMSAYTTSYRSTGDVSMTVDEFNK